MISFAAGRGVASATGTAVASGTGVPVGSVQTIPVSHGEGRFYADKEILSRLRLHGQIATQYADKSGAPSMDIKYNPNTSADAIERIFSPDGKIFVKMGHCERRGENIAINIPGRKGGTLMQIMYTKQPNEPVRVVQVIALETINGKTLHIIGL